MGILKTLFRTYSEREVKRVLPIVDKIVALEDEIRKLKDAELKAKTAEFKERLNNGATLDEILPEAFAVVREAADRVIGLRHYPVQLLGGIILHQGRIAEMKTGEGKTLVATLSAYLNALTGNGVHIVTVNDYLAKRDSEWMGKIYKFLGLSVGLVVHGVMNFDRTSAYLADITYGTNNEFGFDYLRDNMVNYKEQKVQRGHAYAIVDEVDSILIDEARTPLIISGMGEKSTKIYTMADRFVKQLKCLKMIETSDNKFDDTSDYDYVVDEKAHTASLSAKGLKKGETFFGVENLSDPENMTLFHHINQALKAYGLMHRDIDYVVKNGEVIIVDEFTGRLMFGRRYSDGLHQAIEAKEKVNVENESKTLATITFQNYFRLYKKLSGMTGTALTEETEFRQIYSLDVVEIPTNQPNVRKDLSDVIYRNENAKLSAVVEDIKQVHATGQPMLVGTISIEKSELLSGMLKKHGIKHQVLNAKNHEQEAHIIAQAGQKGSVTIATNMAGRGTDIMLGGNAEHFARTEMAKMGYADFLIIEATGFSETDNADIIDARQTYAKLHQKYKDEIKDEHSDVVAAGGLYIIGTERHESRRIDNQLRGRAGRQGDPGQTRFYLSLEDDIMRLFGSDKIAGMIDALHFPENEPIEHSMLTGAIENAQKRVEGRNFDIRKHVIQYDDVMNQQRSIIYSQREKVLNEENVSETILKMIEDAVNQLIETYTGEEKFADYWNLDAISAYVNDNFAPGGEQLNFTREDMDSLTKDQLRNIISDMAHKRYEEREATFGESFREVERIVLLNVVDAKWMDHIDNMDQLRNGISLRAYGQRDPVVEYKFEGYNMFEEMILNIGEETARIILNVSPNNQVERVSVDDNIVETVGGIDGEVKKEPVRVTKVGRNDPCPCGSGKKYKKCCGTDE